MKSTASSVKNDVAMAQKVRINPLMTQDYQNRVRDWARANLKRLRMSQAELARRIGMKDSSYLNHSMRGKRNFKPLEIASMEKIFEQQFPKSKAEQFEVAQERKSARTVALGEIIASGFREKIMVTGAQHTEIPVVTKPRYIDMPQEAWLIIDDSADLWLGPGVYLIVVDYFAARPSIQIGDKIVVKRHHPILAGQGDFDTAQNTAREIAEDDRGIVLKSLSSNPNIRDIVYDPDDKTVIIHKLIIGFQSHIDY